MDIPNNTTRERILDIADDLFSKRGYASVTLRDIASAIGMKHASLYYYAPGGKKQWYIEVMERNFLRHKQGLTNAIASAGDDLRAQMYAVSGWFVSQPPMDLSRMHESDMSEITSEQAERLMDMAFDSLRLPIAEALERANAAGRTNLRDVGIAAIALVSLLQSVHNIPHQFGVEVRHQVGRQLVDMILDGWLKR